MLRRNPLHNLMATNNKVRHHLLLRHLRAKSPRHQSIKISKRILNNLQWILNNSNSHKKDYFSLFFFSVCICLFSFCHEILSVIQLLNPLKLFIVRFIRFLSNVLTIFIYFFFTESGFYSDFVVAFFFSSENEII